MTRLREYLTSKQVSRLAIAAHAHLLFLYGGGWREVEGKGGVLAWGAKWAKSYYFFHAHGWKRPPREA